MGVVYLAEDERLARKVAVKVIAPQLARDEEFRKRFTAEARSAAAIDHPNVVTVYASGVAEDNLFISMKYIEGTDLRSILREQGALDPEVAVTILTEVAAALDAAHAAGLVHRDVKPGNILLDAEPGKGRAYLTDFGLTKGNGGETQPQLTGTGQWVGTIDYVAPEQIQAGTIDARTDIYALGCVLYEMTTGAVPFSGSDLQKMWGHVNEPFPAIEEAATKVRALEPVIRRATAKDPDDRFPSAGDLARASAAALEGGEVEAPEQSVATGAAAEGMAEVAATRKLPRPEMAKTVTGHSPAAARRPAPLPPSQAPTPIPQRRHSDGGSNSTRTAAIIGGAVVIAAGLLAAAVVIAGQGSSGEPSTPAAQVRSTTTAQPPSDGSDGTTNPERVPTSSSPTPLPPDARLCSDGVGVKTLTTSCVFGLNVAREYRLSGGAGEITAYSPKTHTTYTMSCSGGDQVVCTGGEDAIVYINY
jgi:serine/threonine-protein kinase